MKKSIIFNIFKQLSLRKQRSLDYLVEINKHYPLLTKRFAEHFIILGSFPINVGKI